MRRLLTLLACVAFAAVVVGSPLADSITGPTLTFSEVSGAAYEAFSGSTVYYNPTGSNSGSFTVAATASAGSGITSVAFPVVFGSDSLTDSTSPYEQTYSWTSTSTADSTQSVTVTDGDTDTASTSFTVSPDTAPTVSNATPTEVTGAGDQYWNPTTNTLWFRPAAAGSFTLNAVADDAQTGIAQVAFPDVSGTSGWAGSNGGADTSSAYSSPTAYTWTTNAAAPGAKTVTATNGTGMTATAAVTISADSTAPAGQTVALGGGLWYGSTSVPLTIGAGSDAGSGVDSTRGVVERASATLTNGTCGTFGAFAAVTPSGGADTGVSSGNCYRYQYKATDNVGNVSTASAASGDAKVDTTAPTTPTLFFTGFSNTAASGTTVYYGASGGGSFTVTAASSDRESGVASYTFPTISGFTAVGSGSTRTYTFSGTPSAPANALAVTATNASGQTSAAATFTLVADSTPPTLTVLCNGKPCLASAYAKAVNVTLAASDGTGSGLDTIRYTTDGTDPSAAQGFEYVRGFTVSSLTHLKVRAYDKAGNASAPLSVTIRSLANRLLVTVPAQATVKARARSVQVRISTTHRATFTAVMTGAGLKKAARWRFLLSPGTSIVQMRLPQGIKRPGIYKIVWSVKAGTGTTRKTTRVVLRA